MGDKERKTKGPVAFSAETVKMIAESVGVSGLSEEAQLYFADEVTYQLKTIIQDSKKFLEHGKRKRLTNADIDHAIRLRGFEPIYGIHAKDYVPFRHAIGGGREIHYVEEKELDLQDIINSAGVKVPVGVALKSHWLSIEGEQPAVPENPPPVAKDTQQLGILDPTVKAAVNKMKTKVGSEIGKGKANLKVPEKVRLKEAATHELCIEQQHYFVEITDACVGSDELRRVEALTSLATDPGLSQMVPRLCMFISEGVKLNISQNNLALLIYLMRMTKALMENASVYLEKCLHALIPALTSCIVSKQLCQRPDNDNHWALRDFAARLISQLCRSYSTSTNNVQERITNMLSGVLSSDATPLSTRYGVIMALAELGPETLRTFVLPFVKAEADRLACILDNSLGNSLGAYNTTDRNAADHIKEALLKTLPPVLKSVRSPPDSIEEYQSEFGYLGGALHAAVSKLRKTPVSSSSAASALIAVQKPLMQTSQSRMQLGPTSVVLQGPSAATQMRPMTPRLLSLGQSSPSTRVMYVQQRPSVPIFQNVSNQPNSQTAVIRVVSSGSSTPGTSTVSGQSPKILVMTSTPAVQSKTVPDLGMKSIFGGSGISHLGSSSSSVPQDPSNLDGGSSFI